ncbi:prolipoprotein diacylglyceryl transferase [Labilibacter sediminis]|nr:prolipoprotein diacylglyceryl transferase [Labilibacter sediminis]
MLNKLKLRWGIDSNFQIILILIVFSVTGSAAVYVKKIIFDLLNIDADTSLWIKIPMYIITIIPSYQILLLVVGTIFGQFRFFYNFQKKSFGRFVRSKKADDTVEN